MGGNIYVDSSKCARSLAEEVSVVVKLNDEVMISQVNEKHN